MSDIDDFFRAAATSFKDAERELADAERSLLEFRRRLDSSLERLENIGSRDSIFTELQELLQRRRANYGESRLPIRS
jgi:hypothetical protein